MDAEEVEMNVAQRKAIFTLWDELADFPASQCDEALNHLMSQLCRWLDAQDVVWVGAVRIGQGVFASRDPLYGWRGLAVRHHSTSPEILALSMEASKEQDSRPVVTTLAGQTLVKSRTD